MGCGKAAVKLEEDKLTDLRLGIIKLPLDLRQILVADGRLLQRGGHGSCREGVLLYHGLFAPALGHGASFSATKEARHEDRACKKEALATKQLKAQLKFQDDAPQPKKHLSAANSTSIIRCLQLEKCRELRRPRDLLQCRRLPVGTVRLKLWGLIVVAA